MAINISCNQSKKSSVGNKSKIGHSYYYQYRQKDQSSGNESKSPVHAIVDTIHKLVDTTQMDEDTLVFETIKNMLFIESDDWFKSRFTSLKDRFKPVKQPWRSFFYQLSRKLKKKQTQNKIQKIKNIQNEIDSLISVKNQYLAILNSAELPESLLPHGILLSVNGDTLYLNEHQEREITKYIATIYQTPMEITYQSIFMQHFRYLMKFNYKDYNSINFKGINAWYQSTKRINSRKRKYDNFDIQQNKRPKICRLSDVLPAPLPPPNSIRIMNKRTMNDRTERKTDDSLYDTKYFYKQNTNMFRNGVERGYNYNMNGCHQMKIDTVTPMNEFNEQLSFKRMQNNRNIQHNMSMNANNRSVERGYNLNDCHRMKIGTYNPMNKRLSLKRMHQNTYGNNCNIQQSLNGDSKQCMNANNMNMNMYFNEANEKRSMEMNGCNANINVCDRMNYFQRNMSGNNDINKY